MGPGSVILGAAHTSFPPLDLHPDVCLVMAALAISYWWALTRLGPRRVDVAAGEQVASRGNIVAFVFAILTMWVFAEYPIHDLAEHYLFSVHMLQHLVFTTVSAPLLLLALPPWLMRTLLVEPRWVHRIVRQITRPVVALVIFNAFLVLTHWPNVTNETTHNELFHFGVHIVMFVTALILWMPMVNQLSELPRLTYPQRMVYLFLQSLVPTVPGAFLVFSSGVVYKAYLGRPELLGISAIADQQAAGAIMKVLGGAILWGLAGYTFFKWFNEEQRQDRGQAAARRAAGSPAQVAGGIVSALEADPRDFSLMPQTLTWDDVARELERTPPPG